MSAPTNTTINTATFLGAILPLTTFQDQHDAGTMYDLWFYHTIPADVYNTGDFAYGNYTTWNPVMTLWRWNGVDPPEQIDGAVSGDSVPYQALVIPGENIYIKCAPPSGAIVSPAITHLSIIEAPDTILANGDIVQNDSSTPFPAAIVYPTTGVVKRFTHEAFAWSESARVLTTGESLVADSTSESCILYDYLLNEVLIVTGLPAGTRDIIIGTDQTTGWWCARSGAGAAHTFVMFVDIDGVASGVSYDMFAGPIAGVTPSLDNTILYCIKSASVVNRDLHKFVLGTLTLTTLVAGGADIIWRPGIMTLLDDTILAGQRNVAGDDNHVFRYDNTGVQLNDYDFGADYGVSYIFAALNDPDEFWVYLQPNVVPPDPVSGFNRYVRVDVATGAFLEDFLIPQFIDGVSQEIGNINAVRFGTSFGGAPFIARVPIPPNIGSGLYILTGTGAEMGGSSNPILRHDVDWIDTSAGTSESVAIPTPYYDTYLAGDE